MIITLDGREYHVLENLYSSRFLDVIRQQSTFVEQALESSLNPNDLWRRGQTTWFKGQGQRDVDGPRSESGRYNTGLGADPFEDFNDMKVSNVTRPILSAGDVLTDEVSGTNTVGNDFRGTFGIKNLRGEDGDDNVKILVADPDAGALHFIEDPGWTGVVPADWSSRTLGGLTPTSVVGYPGAFLVGCTTALLRVNTDPITWHEIESTQQVDLVAWELNRLIVASGVNIYNIVDDSAAAGYPSSLTSGFPFPTDWEWVSITSVSGWILLAGVGNGSSWIYRMGLQSDGVGLDVPQAATQLPFGERILSISSYLDLLIISTDQGFRVGNISSDGDIVYGSLVSSPQVKNAVGNEDNLFLLRDETIGRKVTLMKADPSVFLEVGSLAIPFADLVEHDAVSQPKPFGGDMKAANDAVLFALDQHQLDPMTEAGNQAGIHVQYFEDIRESSISWTSGKIDFGQSEPVMFHSIRRSFSGKGTFKTTVDFADGTSVVLTDVVHTLSTESYRDTVLLAVTDAQEWAEVTIQIDGGDRNTMFHSFTLYGMPIPRRTEQVILPLDLRRTIDPTGSPISPDWGAERTVLRDLVRSGGLVEYVEFGRTQNVMVENVQFGPELDVDNEVPDWEGVAVVTLRMFD